MNPPQTFLKLLHLVDSLHAGGMENIVAQVCNGLEPGRFEPAVCCLTRGGPFEERLRPEIARANLGKPPGFQWRSVLALRRLLRKGDFDVVHTHHLGGLIYAALARGLARRPRIIHSEHIILHGWELERRRIWQRRLFYRLADRVFTLTRQQRDQLDALGLGHPGLFILPNGVDCNRFQPLPAARRAALRTRLGLAPDAVWFGKVARFATAKRHRLLIDAFERAAQSRPALRLLLVGDGGVEKEGVLARIAASHMRDRIHWAGLQNDPAPWYQAMDALVIASDSEGMPNAALEAMACGVPLVANTACGVEEVAAPETHGWIAPMPGAAELAAALAAAAEAGHAERERRGGAGRAHVEREFSLRIMLERYSRLYLGEEDAR
jgi:glycosyltransferase involved in cell wall biosynthesis